MQFVKDQRITDYHHKRSAFIFLYLLALSIPIQGKLKH